MTGLQADVVRQRHRVARLRGAIVSAALADYASTGGLSTSASFFVSKSPTQFVKTLATNAVVEHRQAEMLANWRQERTALGGQEQRAARQVAAVRADRRRLAAHESALHKDVRAAHALLNRLQTRQRDRVLAMQRDQTSNPTNYSTSRGGERPPTTRGAPPVSGRAAVAVATALAQIGKPYVYGAAGPDAFDCSGLTMYAWAAAGVSLSHASSIQSHEGVPVSISDLRPGDLVFYYSPVSHVAMYIGNGMVVHAPHPGSVVQIVPLTSMPIAWARRVG
jgi:cell wall-associated NlpC family hydrolase